MSINNVLLLFHCGNVDLQKCLFTNKGNLYSDIIIRFEPIYMANTLLIALVTHLTAFSSLFQFERISQCDHNIGYDPL